MIVLNEGACTKQWFSGPTSPVQVCCIYDPDPPDGFPLMTKGTPPQAYRGLTALKSTTGFELTVSVAATEFTVIHLPFNESLYWFPLYVRGTEVSVSCCDDVP